jgi:hypothetical protein
VLEDRGNLVEQDGDGGGSGDGDDEFVVKCPDRSDAPAEFLNAWERSVAVERRTLCSVEGRASL